MKCVQCNSTRIIENVRAVDFGDLDRRKDLTIEIAEKPEARVFKGMHEAKVTASVCADCGFVMHSVSKEDAERFFQVQEIQKSKN